MTDTAPTAPGRPAKPGWYWVGEHGPEQMVMRGGEQVIPTSEAILPHLEPDAIEFAERADPESGDGRTLTIRLVKWGEVAERTEEGIRERFAKGAFAGVDPTRVTIEAQGHKRDLVGRGVAIEEREDGAYLQARIANTSSGNDLLTLIREGILSAASVVFRPLKQRRLSGGIVERTSVELARVAILDRGAYPSAAVVSVREEAQEAVVSDEQTTPEPETPAPITPEPVTAPEPAQEDPVPPTPAPVLVERAAPVDLTPLTGRIEAVEQRIAVLASAPTSTESTVPELFQVASMNEFLQRAETDEALRSAMSEFLVERTVADEITTDNAGIVPPAWLREAKRIVNLGRPVINAFGIEALPETGTEIDWPYLSTANTIIGVQSTEKTEITSAKVSFAKGSASLVTYAGYADISYQLAQRSSPSYREARNRVMLAAWAKVTDAAAASGLYTGGTAATLGWDADTTGQSLKEALFSASVEVETATGLPAEFVLCATDVFRELAKLTSIVPPTPTGNPSNAMGTAHAGTLEVNVSGLPLLHARGLGTGQVIVSNRLAARWYEEGPRNVTAEDVAKLGTNDAWYSFAALAIFIPAGIVKLFGPGASGS